MDYYNYRQSVRLTDTEYLGFLIFFPKDGMLKAWVPWFECYRCRQGRGNSINHLRLCHPCASPQRRRAVMLPVPAQGDALGWGLGRGGYWAACLPAGRVGAGFGALNPRSDQGLTHNCRQFRESASFVTTQQFPVTVAGCAGAAVLCPNPCLVLQQQSSSRLGKQQARELCFIETIRLG